jgi:isocitrate/isopropylmalate dehydrogenase
MSDATPQVAVIPGDDAAPEAMKAALPILKALAPDFAWDPVPPGRELAELEPEARFDKVRGHIDAADTVLFGSTNGTTPGVIYMRWQLGTYANVRPIRWRPGYRSPMASPSGIDYVIVRENLEDMYVGIMGDAKALLASGLVDERARLPENFDEGRFAAKVITREGTERVARFACELALGRGRKLTVSAKTNMLPATDRYFCKIAREIAETYPDLTYEEYIVDDMASRLVQNPHDLDVLLLPNLYGDILSDEGAATIGGLGLAPSGCYGDDFAYFESAHGTAPDIAGQNCINPTATLLSGAMMLAHLGRSDAGRRLDSAVAAVYAKGRWLTRDQGGNSSTTEFAAAVGDAL